MPTATPTPPSGPTAIIIIPARLNSVRFPEKILASDTGRPLIQHVYDAARAARSAARVVVATDSNRVVRAVHSFGGEALLTSPSHTSGTSRTAEAVRALALPPDALVVNLQGDEPEMEPATIDAAVAEAVRTGAPMATAAAPLDNEPEAANPNVVKVVLRADGAALYFSRARIPFERDRAAGPDAVPLRHIGVYVYPRWFLDTYVSLPASPLERAEQLEQLRVLERGYLIAVARVPTGRPGIDTPGQYADFVSRWRTGRAAL